MKKLSFVSAYGPWALVTGASDGIGMEIASELARKGLRLVLVARRRERLERMVGPLRDAGAPEIRIVASDLSTKEGRNEVTTATAKLEIGLLVAAAGFGTSGGFLAGSDDQDSNMLDLNCLTPMVLSRHYGQNMAKRGRGGVIFLSSILGFQGVPGLATYAATKGFVQVLGEGLSRELEGTGVDVLNAAPGPVASGFSSRADMTYPMADKPSRVAQRIVAALGRKRTVYPGPVATLLSTALGMLSRSMRVGILGTAMKPMINGLK